MKHPCFIKYFESPGKQSKQFIFFLLLLNAAFSNILFYFGRSCYFAQINKIIIHLLQQILFSKLIVFGMMLFQVTAQTLTFLYCM